MDRNCHRTQNKKRFKAWIPACAGMTTMLLLLCFMLTLPVLGESTWDSERLNLEIRMQQRVEESLAKILPPGQFVVVIRIEPLVKSIDSNDKQNDTASDGYFLPGVPTKMKLDNSDDEIKNAISSLRTDQAVFQRFIRRISVTLVLDQDLADDMVSKVRELTRQMLGLDPQRGDTLDIQRTVFQKTAVEKIDNSGLYRFQSRVQHYWMIISLALILFCITVFLLFVFGPLRGFLNRFVTTMATMKPVDNGEGKMPRFGFDPQILPGLMAQNMGLLPPGGFGGGGGPANFSGSLQVENPNKRVMPFGFIREESLGNLATLLSRETPERAAVVLGYLPTDWISRVLSKMDPAIQSQVTDHLATTRQLLPEQVEDIEQDLKRRLDYLIGGPDRIIAVYESLDPDAQKRMLDNLKESRPDIAEELRQRTLLFEDLDKLEPTALKALLREVDLQTLVQSLKGTAETLRARILENIPAGKAEIVREELDMSDAKPTKATLEAQRKIAFLAKRLEREGQIQIPSIEGILPSTRFGVPLRSSVKIPTGMKSADDQTIRSEDVNVIDAKSGIEERIKKFMRRRPKDQERFPASGDDTKIDTGTGA